MARARKLATEPNDSTPATSGHNKPPLTEDEAGALTVYYELKIIEDQRKVDAKKVELDGLREVVNGHYKRMTADLHFTRKEFEAEVIVKGRMTEVEYLNSEARRSRLHVLSGRKPGEQLSILDAIQDTADEAVAAEQDGYRAGRRADDPTPPSTVSPILHTDWMRGWHMGQEYNGAQLTKAHEILARPKPGTMVAGTDPDETGDESDELDEDTIAAGAKALQKAGWVEPTEAETQFEVADGGKTIRKPRNSAKTPEAAAA
jgi:hypothetical protein